MLIQWLGVKMRLPISIEVTGGDDRDYKDLIEKLVGDKMIALPIGSRGRDIMVIQGEDTLPINQQASQIAGRPLVGDVVILASDDWKQVTR